MCVCVWSRLASTILTGPLRRLVELWPLFGAGDGRVVVVQALRHPLADDVHQPLEGLLHVDVVFSARLEVLETCRGGVTETDGERERERLRLRLCEADPVNPFISSCQDTSRLRSDRQLKPQSPYVSFHIALNLLS